MQRKQSESRFAAVLRIGVMIDHQLGDEDHHLERYIVLSRA
jgi:hypothetical protein